MKKNMCVGCSSTLEGWHTAECYAFFCPNKECGRYGLLTATDLERIKYPLTKKQKEVINLANPYLRVNDLVKAFGIKPSTAEARIYLLIRKGYLVKESFGLYKATKLNQLKGSDD